MAKCCLAASRTPVILLCITFMFVLSSCRSERQLDITAHIAAGEVSQEIISKSNCHVLYKQDSLYYYSLLNKEQHVFFSDGPFSKPPQIEYRNSHLLRVCIQGGTGIGTRNGYYYDIDADLISDVFKGLLDDNGFRVAYCKGKAVVIQDIFDKNRFYAEIADFQYPLARTACPFVSVFLPEDGLSVWITYISDDDYREVSQNFCLEAGQRDG